MITAASSHSSAPLVGIARLASEASLLSAKREVEYRSLTSRSILNRCSNPRMPFSWTINPYRGCEIGCRYCYARYTHEFMGMDGGRLFETRIYAKSEAAELLKKDLRRPCAGGIAIGTSTDPYQPAEKRFGVTRGLLEVFAAEQGRELTLTTKSDLVVRDADLLQAIGERNRLAVNITLTTLDESSARLIEPRAPRPDLRLGAVRSLSEAGIQTGVFVCPVLPWITDDPQGLENLAHAARDAGASYLAAEPLFLKDSARRVFFPLIREHFPHLVDAYETLYRWDAYPRHGRIEKTEGTLRNVRERFDLASMPVFNSPRLDGSQLSLFA